MTMPSPVHALWLDRGRALGLALLYLRAFLARVVRPRRVDRRDAAPDCADAERHRIA